MDKYFSVRDQAHLLFELVESLNKGNSCSWDERVAMAEKQFEQLECAVARLQAKKEAGF